MQAYAATALFQHAPNQNPQAIINCANRFSTPITQTAGRLCQILSDRISAAKFNFDPCLNYVDQSNDLRLPQSALGKGASYS